MCVRVCFTCGACRLGCLVEFVHGCACVFTCSRGCVFAEVLAPACVCVALVLWLVFQLFVCVVVSV